MSNLLPEPLEQSAQHAAHLGSFALAELLPGAGSERRYWRLTRSDQSTALLMYHGAEREENAAFAPLTHWLLSHELRVPQILAETSGEFAGSGWIWLEDFGTQDLLALAHQTQFSSPRNAFAKNSLQQAYLATIEQLVSWHQLELSTLSTHAAEHLQEGFGLSLYQWEQDYFWEHAIGRLSNLEAHEQQQARQQSQAWLAELAQQLTERPSVVIHRDFQSTNVMVLPKNSEAETTKSLEVGIIDYQGLRLGLAEYDLASLLFDPYVTLPPELVKQSLIHYAQRSGQKLETLQQNLALTGIQRLMQALGAYGKLGLLERKTRFLRYIKPARNRLKSLLEHAQAPKALFKALQSVQDATRFPDL